jgi:radical SAM superfamily enzyme YgiQ (UPF0313 family)
MNKQLDILFVHPNASAIIYQNLSQNHSAIEPPIWAGMLANHCRVNNFGTAILDCEVEHLSWLEAAEIINDINPRIVCFVVYGQQPSASTQNMSGAIGTANLLKQLNPKLKTLFVGGHISALPKEVLKESCVDMVCQNEGVYTISNLLQTDLSEQQIKNVKGLGYKINGEPVLNTPERLVPKNMLEIDLPGVAWDLLPSFNKYRTSGWHSWSNNTEQYPFASLYTSLGCPYKCSFCMINIINRTDNADHISAANSNVFRWWNPEFIIQQFDHFAKMGVKNIKIADELFVLNPRHFQKICELIVERGYDFNIWAYSRVDTCKPQYLDILKKAGVNWLGLGIENPNQTLRQEIHKDHFVDIKITDLMNNMRSAGINIGGNYIFGLPMDTKESLQSTLEFAMENKTEMVNFYCAMAYPGSPLYHQAKEKNWSLPSRYEGFSQHSYYTQNLPNNHLTAAEILEFRDKAFITYNSNPEYLQLLENKFGTVAKENMEKTLKIKLKRQLLND